MRGGTPTGPRRRAARRSPRPGRAPGTARRRSDGGRFPRRKGVDGGAGAWLTYGRIFTSRRRQVVADLVDFSSFGPAEEKAFVPFERAMRDNTVRAAKI